MMREPIGDDEGRVDREELVGRLADELAQQLASGDKLDLEEFRQRYPDLAADLPEVVESVRALQGLRREGSRGSSRTREPLDSEITPPFAGGQLGDFQLLREIGRGGMGVVYEAEQLSLGRTVALKVLPFAAVLDETAIKRFKNEAKAAATLEHPHIVPIHAVGNDRGVYYYAMSLINGLTLANVIEAMRVRGATDGGPNPSIDEIITRRSRESRPDNLDSDQRTERFQSLDHLAGPGHLVEPGVESHGRRQFAGSPRRTAATTNHFRNVARLSAQAAEALHFAHEHGIVHRDVKPGNLMVDGSGELLVTDFGLARIETDAGLTMTGDLLGTLRYMAPEQALAKRVVVDHRADVYSLGATLYELLTLRPAFGESDRQALLKQIAFDEPRQPRQIDPSIPRELETIVLKAMSKHPDGRYATAQHMADDLGRFLAGEPIQARRATPFESMRKWCGRHRTAATAIAISALATVLIVSLSLRYAYVVGRLSSHLSHAVVDAEALRVEAETARNDAVARGEELRQQLYVHDMSSAYAAWRKGWTGEVYRLLAKQSPQPGELNHRGFEWKILRKLIYREPPIELSGHDGPVNNVAVFAGGTKLASVGDDATIRIWNLETLEQEFVLRDTRRTETVEGDPTSELPAAYGQTETVVVSAASNDYRALAVSPDGRMLVTGNLVLSLWDLEERRFVRDLALFPTRIFGAAFSPDGSVVAAQCGDHEVQVISLKDGLLKRFETGHGSYRLGFSPSGAILAAPYKNSTGFGIRCWDTTNWEWIRDYRGTQLAGSNRGLAFTKNEKFLFSGTYGHNLSLLDLSRGTSPLQTPSQRARLTDIDLSPDDSCLAATHADGSLICWSLRDDWQAHPENALDGPPTLIPAHQGAADAVRFITNDQLATCGDDGLVRLWNRKHRAGKRRISDLDFGEVIAITPDGNEILIAQRSGIQGYDTKTLSLLRDVEISENQSDARFGKVVAITVSQDERVAGIGSTEGVIAIFDLRTDREIHRIEQLDVRASRIDDIDFSRDSKWLASAGRDHTVRIRSTDDWREVHRIDTHGWGSNVEFSPDGRYLAYSDSDGELRLLETSTWRDVAGAQAATGTQNNALCFTPNGRALLSGHIDSIIRVWDVPSLTEVGQLKGHARDVTKVAVHPDCMTVASTSHDRTVRLWHLPTRTEFGTLDVGAGTAWDCQFSPDGSQLVTTLRNHETRIYECNIWDVTQPAAGD